MKTFVCKMCGHVAFEEAPARCPVCGAPKESFMSNDDVIHGHHLPPTLQTAEASGTTISKTLDETIEGVEREMLLEALKSSRGNMAKAARLLGISERRMGLRIRRYGIDPKRFDTHIRRYDHEPT